MYMVYCNYKNGDQLLYNDTTPDLEVSKLISPELQLSDNAAGSFKATVPTGNQLYSIFNLKKNNQMVKVDVYRDNTWVWSGRVLSSDMDFWGQRTINCEGALAWLNDVVMPLAKMSSYTVVQYVSALLSEYNNAKGGTESKWAILPGAVSTSSSSGAPIGLKDYVVDGDNVLSYLTKLANDWGLHLRIRYKTGKLYLDVLTDDQLPMSSQTIDFGENLLDYSDNYTLADLRTQILPYGKDLDTHTATGDEEFPDKVNISGKTASKSALQVVGQKLRLKTPYSNFGCLEETVTWSDIDDAGTLLSMAELYLSDYQFDSIKLTVKALDLHYVDTSKAAFGFLSKINCVSKPHGLEATFIISEMTLPLDAPENTTFTFSRSTMGLYGSDKQSSARGGKISGTVYPDSAFTREGILKSAKRNARAIMEAASSGYVTMVQSADGTHTEAIVISDAVTPESSTSKWTWNRGGLAYQHRSSVSSSWEDPKVAITMDGAITANMITTGVLLVDDGSGGILLSADLTSKQVKIANFIVKGSKLYSGKSTLSGSTAGVYIGTDGISTGSGDTHMNLASGYLYGGSSTNNACYVGFRSYSAYDDRQGTRVAGLGFVSVLTSGFFGVGQYQQMSSDSSVDSGETGSFLAPTSIRQDGTVADWATMQFKHGLMNTTGF